MMVVAFLIFASLVVSWLLAPIGAEPGRPADRASAGAPLDEPSARAA